MAGDCDRNVEVQMPLVALPLATKHTALHLSETSMEQKARTDAPIEHPEYLKDTLLTTAVSCGRDLYCERRLRVVVPNHREAAEAVTLRAAVLVFWTKLL